MSAPARPADVVDALVDRARTEGRLSLDQLRTVFDAAGIGPTEARAVLRELSEQGAVVMSDDLAAVKPTRARRRHKARQQVVGRSAGEAGRRPAGDASGRTHRGGRPRRRAPRGGAQLVCPDRP